MKSYLTLLLSIFLLSLLQATPTVSFTASTTSGVFPLAVNFNATASDSQSGTLQYLWTFGDGNQTGITGSLGRNVSNTYVSNGTFTVTLTVLNMTTFQSGTATKTVMVNVPTGTYSFPVDATQDAHLKNGASTNDGSFLKVGDAYVAYMKYTIPSLPGNVTEAKLQLTYSFLGGQNGAVAVAKGSNTNWTEMNLTNSNRPISVKNYGNINTNTSTFVYTKTITLSDITEGGVLNLILTSNNSPEHNFSPSENIFLEERPKLILTVDNSATGSATNLALDGTATQSSTAHGGVASRAIDDNTNGAWGGGSVTHTQNQSNTWWEVDLAQNSDIDQIKIWNRTDCCASRLSNFTVSVLDAGGITVWSQSYSATPNPSLSIDLNATGKTVRVSLNGVLSLAEVQVYGTVLGTNLAPSGVASQSSTAYGGVASRAIDNDTNGRYNSGSVTHTQNQSTAWWQVALEETSIIDKIVLWNRTDCCASRLSNFTVSVLDAGGTTVWSQSYSATPNASLSIDLYATGKTVRVSLNGVLSLAEVQVFGTALGNNLAPSGVASQSSTVYGGVASRAIDNDTNGQYHSGSVTHTQNQSNAWWQVALQQTSTINRIVLWNRTGCCPSRLSNFTVSVLDAGGITVWSQSYSATPNPSLSIDLYVTGKTVRVSLNGVLSLAEVQVFGITNPAVPTTTNDDTFQSNNGLLVDEINTKKQAAIQLYPNPATDILHIANAQDATSIEIYNMAGKLLANHKSTTDMLQVSHLQAGMYVLVVHQEGKQQILKFVKE